jgi:RND family efflux transporter MFP subunit
MNMIQELKKVMRQGMKIVLVASLTFASGCGEATESTPQDPEVAQGLHSQKIQMQDVADELESPGSVIAVSTAQVAARTMGTVLHVAVKEGDAVKRGQMLAQLDERELTSHRSAAQAGAQGAAAGVAQATKAVAAAQAQADVMKKTFDRYSYLKDQKSVSPQEFDEIASKQQTAQANLELAKAGLHQAEAAAAQAESEARAAESVASYARVIAPFDGRVVRRTVEPGSLVTPGVPLFVIEDTSHYQLEATLPAEALAFVKKNATVRVQFDGLDQASLTGKVAELEAGADPASHTLKARIDLPRQAGVQSGMFGRAFLGRGEKRVLMVPVSALVNRGQLQGIYVGDEGGLLHWRVLTLGKRLGSQIEVLSGLNDGDTVVLNPGSQELDGKKTSLTSGGGEKHS